MKGHWLGCACEVLGITGLDEPFGIPPSILKGTPAQKLTFVRAIAEVVVNKMTLMENAFLDTTHPTRPQRRIPMTVTKFTIIPGYCVTMVHW